MSAFSCLTPATYLILVALWAVIAVFYFQRRKSAKNGREHLLEILLLVLLLDASRTIVENLFFGTWYSAKLGFLPEWLSDFLVRPHIVFIPKALSVLVAIAIIIIIRRWLPREGLESTKQRKRAEELEVAALERTRTFEEGEKRYRRLVESTSTIPWEFDLLKGRFTYVGPQIEKILMLSPDSWKTLDDWAVSIIEEDREQSVNFCEIQTGKGLDHTFEYRMRRFDGCWTNLRSFILPIS